LVLLLLVVATLAAYSQLPGNGFVNFDDDVYVTENPQVGRGLTLDGIAWSFSTFRAGNWHPLTWLSHMLDTTLFGMVPAGHHVGSLLIHVLNGVVLFFVLETATRSFRRAAFVAAVFLLHPLGVESVAWVAERKNLLSTLFFLLTLAVYARYARRPSTPRYLAALALFALALLAKPIVVTLPCVLLLLDFWPLERVRENRERAEPRPWFAARLIAEKVPFLAFSLLASLATLHAHRQVGGIEPMDAVSLQLRIGNALVAYVRYMAKIAWPRDLAAFYPHPDSIPAWQAAGAALVLVGLTALSLRAVRAVPSVPVGWFWFVGTLVPVLGLVHGGGQSMADRYTYVPLIGLAIVVAWGVPHVLATWRHERVVLALVSGVFLLGCAARTFAQVSTWKDGVTLWAHAIEVTQGNFIAHDGLGHALALQGQHAEAASHYERAIAIDPDHERPHNNLGIALEQLGRPTEAILQYREALRIKPDYVEAHVNLGVALARTGRLDEAVHHLSTALALRPDFAPAHYNLGAAMLERGDRERAGHHFSEALRLDPRHEGAKRQLALLSRKRSG
jgi:tetratricopeptide (TPR) repeat protein